MRISLLRYFRVCEVPVLFWHTKLKVTIDQLSPVPAYGKR